jgi:hypothetical protein
MGMTLSPDRTTLYTALASGHAVTAISTATLRETASYPTGSISPYDVAVQGGTVCCEARSTPAHGSSRS